MASGGRAQRSAEPARRELTTFGLLQDPDEGDATSALAAGVGDFFNRVKSVLASATGATIGAGETSETAHHAAIDGAQAQAPQSATMPIAETQQESSAAVPGDDDESLDTGSRTSTAQRSSHVRAPSLALRTVGSRSLAAAGTAPSAITTASVAVMHGLASSTSAPFDGLVSSSMIVEDGNSTVGEIAHHADALARQEEMDDVGSMRHRGSGKHRRVVFPRTNTIESAPDSPSGRSDGAGSSGGFWVLPSMPGFQFSRDLLADDVRSVHSSSGASARYRARNSAALSYDWDEQEAGAGGGGRGTPTYPYSSAAALGLQTSADIISRSVRSEGFSKKFWMQDDYVKSCRTCNATFGAFRRRHHCRICGWIFCSNCANNFIPGARFDRTESLRACDACLKQLEEHDAEEEAAAAQGHVYPYFDGAPYIHPSDPTEIPRRPRRITHKSSADAGRVRPGMISGPLEAQVKAPHSQFAANHLFARKQMQTLAGISQEAADTLLRSKRKAEKRDVKLATSFSPENPQAPFRKVVLDEASPTLDVESFAGESAVVLDTRDDAEPEDKPKRSRPSLALQAAVPGLIVEDAASAHKDGEVERVAGVIVPTESVVSEASPVLESAGSDPMLHFTFPASLVPEGGVEEVRTPNIKKLHLKNHRPSVLSEDSQTYLTTMCKQMLEQSKIKDAETWRSVIIPLVLKAVFHIRPNAMDGDMDIRSYVKIKRIPGGRPEDTQYVDGFVCTKHVATKAMARRLPLHSARVMIVSFPIEYQRPDAQIVSLEPVMAQEHEYLRVLVGRILALRPQILVAEKSVSRFALELLEAQGVIVVWSLKPSAVEAISRCTLADIITSVDRLALDPHLGRVTAFDVERFKLEGSQDANKCLMRFGGANQSLGCTILLRGAGPETLRRVKRIVDFLCFVGYNLSLEQFLMADGGVTMHSGRPAREEGLECISSALIPAAKRQQQQVLQREAECIQGGGLSKATTRLLQLYDGVLISASSMARIPPPYPLARMRQIASRLSELRRIADEEEVRRIRLEEERDSAALTPLVEKTEAQAAGIPTPDPAQSSSARLQAIMQNPEEIRRQVEFAVEQSQFCWQLRNWRQYLTRCPDAISPLSHQRLTMLMATTSSATNRPCAGPALHQVDYYGDGDETLGRYFERQCDEAPYPCRHQTCDKDNMLHYETYIHNEVKVRIIMERYLCPFKGEEHLILVWDYCKICNVSSKMEPLSDQAWSYSLAKFLELHFYAAEDCPSYKCSHHFFPRSRPLLCPPQHDIPLPRGSDPDFGGDDSRSSSQHSPRLGWSKEERGGHSPAGQERCVLAQRLCTARCARRGSHRRERPGAATARSRSAGGAAPALQVRSCRDRSRYP